MTMSTQSTAEPVWLSLLRTAIAANPRGKAGVADAMGITRPYICRVLSGSIPVPSPRFIGRVLKTYQRIDCPHLGTSLAYSECQAHASRTYAALSHMEVDHWRACQRCPHRPVGVTSLASVALAPVCIGKPTLLSTHSATALTVQPGDNT